MPHHHRQVVPGEASRDERFRDRWLRCGAVPTILMIGWLSDRGAVVVAALAALAALVAVVVVPVAGRMLKDPSKHWLPAHIDTQAWAVDRQLNRSLSHNIPAARHCSPGEALRPVRRCGPEFSRGSGCCRPRSVPCRWSRPLWSRGSPSPPGSGRWPPCCLPRSTVSRGQLLDVCLTDSDGGAFYAIFANVVLGYFGDRSLLQNR